MLDRLTHYYMQQGRGEDDFYRASYVAQKGYGMWGLFSNLWRHAKPFFASAGKTLGRQALSTGGQILSDIASTNKNPADIASARMDEAKRNIAARAGTTLKAMSGMGYRRKRVQNGGKRKKSSTQTGGNHKKQRKQTRKVQGGNGVKRKHTKTKTQTGGRRKIVKCGSRASKFDDVWGD